MCLPQSLVGVSHRTGVVCALMPQAAILPLSAACPGRLPLLERLLLQEVNSSWIFDNAVLMDRIRGILPWWPEQHVAQQEGTTGAHHASLTPLDSNDVGPPPQSTSHFHFPVGEKVLHDCPDAAVDICFIHGLTGGRETTWTAEGQSEPWPKTLIPSELCRARILTYGYDAYVIRGSVASTNRLIDHATNLLHDLTRNRSRCKASSRPLIFVLPQPRRSRVQRGHSPLAEPSGTSPTRRLRLYQGHPIHGYPSQGVLDG